MTRSVLTLIGVAYHTADLAAREALALDRDAAGRLLQRLASTPGVHGSAVLTTCSRTELYVHAANRTVARRAAAGAVRAVCGRRLQVGRARRAPHGDCIGAFSRTGPDAVEHLLRIAAGVESPVLGDVQVLGQVKDAYAEARRAGATDAVVNRLFETALRAGRRARRETGIGRGSTSAASAAAALVARAAAPLATRRVAIVGAGETASIAARHIARLRPAALVIVNRTLARADALAREIGASALPLDALANALRDADVVVSATSRIEPVIALEQMARAMRARPDRPLLAVDLAVPRDIDWRCAALPNVRLHAIDEVQAEAVRCLAERAAHVPAVEAIVAEEVERFGTWQAAHDAAAVIRAVRTRIEQAHRRLTGPGVVTLPPNDRTRAERASRRQLGRALHGPTVWLRTLARRPGGLERLESLRARLAG
jgi:glutamyl-tRNA reductase